MKSKLKELIEELIREKEKELGTHLTIENFDFLSCATSKFVKRNIDKYIRGAIEHNDSDFITSVDHLEASLDEIFDMYNYISAAIIKNRKHDERYK